MEVGKLRQDKGVAGLTILLSLVTMLFVIGMLVFIFSLMGGGFKDVDSLKASESTSTTQNLVTLTDAGTTLTTCGSANQGAITVITVINATSGETVSSGNYTVSGCVLTGIGTATYNGTSVNTTYTFTSAGTGWDVVNESATSIAGVTDWFSIFIVLTAMVVLILLTVIIITAIRGSGLMVGGSSGESIGSA